MPTKLQEESANLSEVVLNLSEAAAYLRVSEDALAALAEQDAIPAQKIGLEWRFLKSALAEWLSFGHHRYMERKRFPLPWFFEPFPTETWMKTFVDRFIAEIAISEKQAERAGSKKAVLKHFGIFREDDDLDERLAEMRAKRESAG